MILFNVLFMKCCVYLCEYVSVVSNDRYDDAFMFDEFVFGVE